MKLLRKLIDASISANLILDNFLFGEQIVNNHYYRRLEEFYEDLDKQDIKMPKIIKDQKKLYFSPESKIILFELDYDYVKEHIYGGILTKFPACRENKPLYLVYLLNDPFIGFTYFVSGFDKKNAKNYLELMSALGEETIGHVIYHEYKERDRENLRKAFLADIISEFYGFLGRNYVVDKLFEKEIFAISKKELFEDNVENILNLMKAEINSKKPNKTRLYLYLIHYYGYSLAKENSNEVKDYIYLQKDVKNEDLEKIFYKDGIEEYLNKMEEYSKFYQYPHLDKIAKKVVENNM